MGEEAEHEFARDRAADVRGGLQRLGRERQDFAHPVDEQADHPAGDLGDEDGVAGGGLGPAKAEPRAEIDDRQHRAAQVHHAADVVRRLRQRRRLRPAADLADRHQVDAEGLLADLEGDQFHPFALAVGFGAHQNSSQLSSAASAFTARAVLPRDICRAAGRGAAARGLAAGAGRRAGAALAMSWPVLNWPTRLVSFSASCASEWLAAVDSSTMAAFCWVIWSIWLTAVLTWWSPVACSWADAAISVTIPVISVTCWAMRVSALPVSPTRFTPEATCVVEAEISALISLAASAERWARARTSEATTAKPLPASPARAASTPAFSAKRFVWKAISSMTPMIWEISWADFSIAPIATTASCTTLPEASASALAAITTSLACLAPSAVLRTVAVISSKAAAVSSSEAACCSVRLDRSSEAWLISPTPLRMPPVASTMERMVACRRSSAALKSSCSFRYSAGNSSSRRYVRSPSERWARPLPMEETTTACSCAARSRAVSLRTRSASVAPRAVEASSASR